MTKPTPPVRLTNVFGNLASPDCKVSATLTPEIYSYFFRHVIAGHHGSQQALISNFFQKLYDHCVNDAKIAKCYDPDNINQLAAIINRLNFRDEVSDNRATSLRRRAAASPAKPPGKSKPADRKRSATRGPSPQVPGDSSDATETESTGR